MPLTRPGGAAPILHPGETLESVAAANAAALKRMGPRPINVRQANPVVVPNPRISGDAITELLPSSTGPAPTELLPNPNPTPQSPSDTLTPQERRRQERKHEAWRAAHKAAKA